MKVITSLSVFFLCLVSNLPAQHFSEKGVPLLRNFTPGDYDHRGKVWDIDTAPNGIVYMASDKGLLEYDGGTWNSFEGSDGITRSVLVASDSLVYTGSDLDFGVWNRDKFNDFEYTSLYPFREDLSQLNEEFWNIHELNGSIYFVSSSNIYLYRDQNLTKIPAPVEIDNSYLINGTLYFVDEEEGLFELRNLSPVQLTPIDDNRRLEVIGLYEQNDDLILVTQNSGLYRYRSEELMPINSQLSENLKSANVFSFETVGESYIAFGSILSGVYISDRNGNIAHHLTKNKGLKNNTILSLHYSDIGKLWLGMDFGVAYVDLRNEFTFFYDYLGDFGTGYVAILEDGVFYLGSNQGLYRSDWDALNNSSELDDFELIEGTEGQVWALENIDGQVWMGHDNGLFQINEDRPVRVGQQRGIWTIRQYQGVLLAGTYNGISIFKEEQESWVFDRQMELILGSCNQVIIEGENTMWVNIPNFGVIKAELDENLYPQEREIFLSDQFKGQDHMLVQDTSGVRVVTELHEYSYDRNRNSFTETERNSFENGINDLILRNSEPVLLNADYEFYPVYNGFALRQLSRPEQSGDMPLELTIRKLEAYSNDELVEIFDGAEVSHNLNNLRVVANVPNRNNVMYQYRASDIDEWSDLTRDNVLELVGLGYGKHTFFVRALVGDKVTPPTSFSLIISAPWYLSWPALLFYFFAVTCFFYMMYVWQGMSLSKQKKYLLMNQRNSLREQKERYRRQLQQVEEDKLRAEYDKVKAQLKSKTIELATKAKENDEKQKILQSLNEKIEKLKKNPDSLKRQSDEIQRIIDTHIDSEDNTFEIQIDELHQEFFDILRNEYPDLTRYDLRLCVYIKMGFDSKEISDLLNIKPSSVYISRSRLRKKIGLDSEEDLHAFLNSVVESET